MIATLQAICYHLVELLTPPKLGKYDLSLVSVFQKYCYQLVMKMATPFPGKMWLHNTIFSMWHERSSRVLF